MMPEHYLILALIALVVFQHVYMTITVNKLVNKLMSRNYFEYAQGRAQKKKKEKFEVKIDEEPTEHLSVISDLAAT